MIKPIEKLNFSEPILNTTKLGFNRLSVYNSVFNFLDGDDALAKPLSSNTYGETWAKPHTNTNTITPLFFITSVLNYNNEGIPLLYSTITPGAYELTEIGELIKKELMVILL